MPIPYTCPHCKLQTIVDDQYAGKSGPCAGCGVVVVIPLVSNDRIASKSDHPIWKWLRIICLMLGILAMVGVGVAIVTVIALPTYTAARNSSRREICADNLERIAAAMDGYRQEHGHYPPAFSVDENGQPLHSWRVLILPYLGPAEQSIYDRFVLDKPWDDPANAWQAMNMPTVFECPADPDAGSGMTSYMVITGRGTMFEKGVTITEADLQSGDGASQTILVVESSQSSVPWNHPTDINSIQLQHGINSGVSPSCCSKHLPAGMNVVYADGTVQFLPEFVAAEDLHSLSTVKGGEVVPPLD